MIYAPLYYKKFGCIAERCKHSCCVGWRVEVGEEFAARLSGTSLEEKLKQYLGTDDDGEYIRMTDDGVCPFLDKCGLCEIISSLGEGYISEICREHPRFYNEVGTRFEAGLGASCEEAARLILSEENFSELVVICEEEFPKLECDATPELLSVDCRIDDTAALFSIGDIGDFDVLEVRDKVLMRLARYDISYREIVAELEGEFGFSADMPSDEWNEMFGTLEYLDDGHKALFEATDERCAEALEVYLRRFLGYLTYRHASVADSRADFAFRIGFALLGARALEGMLINMGVANFEGAVECARIFSEEIEYSLDNTDALIFAVECRLI